MSDTLGDWPTRSLSRLLDVQIASLRVSLSLLPDFTTLKSTTDPLLSHKDYSVSLQATSLPSSSMASAKPSLPSVGLALGTYQLGALITTLVYGVTLAQFYTYAISSKKDRVWLRLFVTLVWYALSSLRHFHCYNRWQGYGDFSHGM
jgi:hypothetical protein